jgi:16S rRNA (cytosine1402-N4)-methyltransferase
MENAPHIPVMLAEVIEHLDIADGDHVVDGTFGAGGYSRAILKAGAQVTAIDRDPDAIANGQAMVEEFGGRLKLVSGRFGDLDDLSGELVDGVVLDIGVSSMQLDQAERGFSFRQDGPLDMRMEQQGLSAADVVNHMARTDLTRLIGIWGEDRKAPQISKAIEKRRLEAPFATTLDLARLVEKTIGQSPKDRIHPATRTFQALRIFVNRELHQLCDALFAAERALKPGGRLVVVTFHSLEDRIVKRFFADRSGGQKGSRFMPEAEQSPVIFEGARKAISASQEEASQNPRARSAKLRSGIRTSSPVATQDYSIFGLPNLPDPADIAEKAGA